MKMIVIDPNKWPRFEEIEGYEAIVKVVGGYLEMISFSPHHAMYVDEESKIKAEKPIPNPLATLLCNSFDRRLKDDDYIANTAVIFSVLDADGKQDGEEYDASPKLLKVIECLAYRAGLKPT